ncbi:lower collar connector protein [Rhizobium phage RHph_N3_8]|uniref:lower collar connector protein n=1 Tax=Rhizobium phage RHph_N3_8 TaxID=2509748 RepID=UPI001AF7DFB3|nr:lower collar connector protein [Rhizobium phage RHph_N3_8]QIG76015.1 lower collar connector protein [Rhizobium phage RHph_N3_8]
MSTFTLTLQQVIDFNKPEDRYKCLGLDVYPIFDEAYRPLLNEKIIAHFNEQEIAHETDSMWEYAMRRRMNEIMPLYNQHYKASQINIDPLKTVDIKAIGSSDESSTTESTTTADGRVVASNTPQVRLAGNADYATGAQDSKSETGVDGTASNTTSNEHSTSGYQGNPAELVMAMRLAFVNVDMMVITELETDMFMLVTDSGAEYTRGNAWNDYYTGYGYPFWR